MSNSRTLVLIAVAALFPGLAHSDDVILDLDVNDSFLIGQPSYGTHVRMGHSGDATYDLYMGSRPQSNFYGANEYLADINVGHENDDAVRLVMNHTGYLGGTTFFRDFIIANGKQQAIAFFDGSSGNVGIGTTSPVHPLEMGSGAHVTSGGVWTDASSRAYKENIRDLELAEATVALSQLEPKRYNYKRDSDEEYLGFIAEDVPGLVATADRKSLSPMDIAAVLTKVVQHQQGEIEKHRGTIESQTLLVATQRELIASLVGRLERIEFRLASEPMGTNQ